MTEKKAKPLHCKSLICNEYLCHSDGELFYVENLEILPKTRGTKKRLKKIIICPRCGWENKIYLRKRTGDLKPEKETPEENFSIFRSRF